MLLWPYQNIFVLFHSTNKKFNTQLNYEHQKHKSNYCLIKNKTKMTFKVCTIFLLFERAAIKKSPSQILAIDMAICINSSLTLTCILLEKKNLYATQDQLLRMNTSLTRWETFYFVIEGYTQSVTAKAARTKCQKHHGANDNKE